MCVLDLMMTGVYTRPYGYWWGSGDMRSSLVSLNNIHCV